MFRVEFLSRYRLACAADFGNSSHARELQLRARGRKGTRRRDLPRACITNLSRIFLQRFYAGLVIGHTEHLTTKKVSPTPSPQKIKWSVPKCLLLTSGHQSLLHLAPKFTHVTRRPCWKSVQYNFFFSQNLHKIEFSSQWRDRLLFLKNQQYRERIPHSINNEETGTSEGLWDRLGGWKITNMSFFDVFKAARFALVNSASQGNATGSENVENDMFVIFRLPKRSHNPSLVPVSS